MKQMLRSVVVALALAAPAFAGAPEGPSAAAIAAADTPAEHEALAAAYEKQAAELRALADQHRAMDKEYSGPGYRSLKLGAALHCQKLVAAYEAAAKEADALAASHREAAAAAKAN